MLASEMRNFLEIGGQRRYSRHEKHQQNYEEEGKTRFMPLEKWIFARSLDPVFEDVEIGQIRQILTLSLSLKTYGHKN